MHLLDALAPAPVAVSLLPPAEAVGRVLAADQRAAAALPPLAVAAGDGVAVAAAWLDGAGPYAPVTLAAPVRLVHGEPLPPGTDAVVAAADVAWRGEIAELSQPVAPGEGVRAAGTDIAAGTRWRGAGEVLTAWDLPLLAALGIDEVAVRIPRVALLPAGAPGLDAVSPGLAALLGAAGASVQVVAPVSGRAALAAALAEAAAADLLVVVGGTDASAAALGEAGHLAVHGIGLRPGGSAGFGSVGGRPVLLLPGDPAEALATWLVLGAPLLRKLAGAPPPPPRRARLVRKLVSTPGLAELALLAAAEGGLLPLAIGDLPLAAFAQAQAFLVVPAAREGYDAGATVDCRDL